MNLMSHLDIEENAPLQFSNSHYEPEENSAIQYNFGSLLQIYLHVDL